MARLQLDAGNSEMRNLTKMTYLEADLVVEVLLLAEGGREWRLSGP